MTKLGGRGRCVKKMALQINEKGLREVAKGHYTRSEVRKSSYAHSKGWDRNKLLLCGHRCGVCKGKERIPVFINFLQNNVHGIENGSAKRGSTDRFLVVKGDYKMKTQCSNMGQKSQIRNRMPRLRTIYSCGI